MADVVRHIGHVIDVLRSMDAASVQCVATSPPYFGLRDYGLAPVIWEPVIYAPMAGLPPIRIPEHADPDAFVSCAHEWDEQAKGHGQFCRKCGAWRGCLGLETDPYLYIGHLVQVFREVRRVLADDGTLWLNLGDSYASSQHRQFALKPKDLIGIPWRAAFALQADGWYLRSDIIWAKGISHVAAWSGNPMPESVTDRPTRAHEMVFLLSKQEHYFYDREAVREQAEQTCTGKSASFRRDASKRAHLVMHGWHNTHRAQRADVSYDKPTRNLRDVWGITTSPFPEAHFAVWPPRLVRPMILAGTSLHGHCPQCGKRWIHGKPQCACGVLPVPDVVLDPFGGSGTTAAEAIRLRRHAVLIDANADYAALQDARIARARIVSGTSKPARQQKRVPQYGQLSLLI